MKRKLIAIALACAMVFSMIPSLAFADVPATSDVQAVLKALDGYKTDGMTLGNYQDYLAPIEAAEDAVGALWDIADLNDGSDEEKAAEKVLAEVAGYIDYADKARAAYDKKLDELLKVAVDGLATPADILAGTVLDPAPKTPATEIPALVDAALTLAEETAVIATTYPDLTAAEAALFGETANSKIKTYWKDGKLVEGKTISKARVEAVVAAYPQLTSDYATAIDGIASGEGTAIETMYNAVITEYNKAELTAISDALVLLDAYNSDLEREAVIIQAIKDARAAYNNLLMDDASKADELVAIQGYEIDYVAALVADIENYALSGETAVKNIAAVEKARAAYDELVDFYTAADDGGLALLANEKIDTEAVVDVLEAAEGDVVNYYADEVEKAYSKVEDVTAITAENRADVEAFVKAWEVYAPNLTKDELTAIEKGTDKVLKAYADKFAVLKAELDKVVAEEAAKEEQAAQDQADLEAKVAIMGTKVAKVAAKAGKNKATITWKKNKNADGYKVMRATSKNGKFKAVKKNTTKVKFVNKKLKSGKTYYYKVVAYKTIAGKKVWSKDSKIVKVKVK